MRRMLVIGLDCAAPQLLFERFRERLPNLSELMRRGVYGNLESCDPPITIPAWMVMATGKTPGELGLYGFRHRRGYSYRDIWIASSRSIKARRLWDYVAEAGGSSCVYAVPPSYPPYPVKGCLVSCFITPSVERDYTYPRELKAELEGSVGQYIPDVEFRKEDKRSILKGVYEMTERHFDMIKYLIAHKPWSLFFLVEIGLDRIHHAFWKYFDEEHHLYQPGNEFETVVEDYYVYLDEKIGELLKLLDDDTQILIVSDHGAKRMKGAFCINSWLEEEGYLKLRRPLNRISRLEEADVDWSRTIAWGWGGYYARVFINVEGREAQGVVPRDEYEDVREELRRRLMGIRGPNGERWETKVYKPEELYPVCRGNPPDLMVYFDNLYWRSAGTMGHRNIYLPENDTGPDDAVHDKYGLYIYHDPERDLGGRRLDMTIYEVAPLILKAMGLQVPRDMRRPPEFVGD
ncbi:alkaline phosphatase family protein [Candidatus Bathyarchaeota archaeon]|nr:alkaline phosphatase family protein [Candidatus Bathyarchaeota archaeon]